jgi:non-ribosomal peptide synthetase-like protein
MCELSENTVGSRSFIGNSALLPAGHTIGDNCLIGVLSVPPAGSSQTIPGSEWLGSPSFKLPYRKKVEGFNDNQIYKPTFKLFIGRLFIDALRIIIPSVIEIIGLIFSLLSCYYCEKHFSVWITIALLPLIGTFMALGMSFGIVLLKNAIIGTYKPVIKPLWSPYVWLNEVINGAYESIAAPMLMPLLGTPFFSVFLRLLGAKVGKGVFIETLLFGEFDLIEIGDYAALNNDVIVQNHLFEDRIFKSSHLKIGNNCSLGNMAVILYDAETEEGSSVSSLSLIMKGEKIQSGRWQGIPVNTI